jgi:hypothetical protein
VEEKVIEPGVVEEQEEQNIIMEGWCMRHVLIRRPREMVRVLPICRRAAEQSSEQNHDDESNERERRRETEG